MNIPKTPLSETVRRPASLRWIIGAGLVLLAGLIWLIAGSPFSGDDANAVTGGHEQEHDHAGHDHAEHEGHGHAEPIHFPKHQWKSAGLEIAEVTGGSFRKAKWITGKLTVNGDRTAHMFPLVDGRIHDLNVTFGQTVQPGDVLAVIDSRQLGDAKLALYQNRLETRIAQTNYDWDERINENTQALIRALDEGASLEELDALFKDKAMGDFRQKLLGSYADLHKARADYERLKPLTEKGITSQAQLVAVKAAYEAARAKFRSWLEQLKFTARLNALHSKQILDKARSQEEVSESHLFVLGFSSDQLTTIDPHAEGEAIDHFIMRAPFAGTIIEKDASLEERVGPQTRLFTLADLSTLWLQADIYQKHLPLLQELSSDTIRFRSVEYDHVHEAKVFYRGEVLDPQTRTTQLMAVVENADGHLKPGMFVEVELPGESIGYTAQVPKVAVVEEDGETFVFVHEGGEAFVRRDVETGPTNDGTIAIVEGLEPGEQVVVGGLFALKTAMQGEVASSHSH